MKRASILIPRLLIGSWFLAAGISKVTAPLTTLASVYSYQVPLPDWLAVTVAHALPWMEILLGLALLAGLWLPVTAGWTAALLGVFVVLTAQAWWRGLPIDCGCIDLTKLHPALAALSTPSGATLRNLVLLALCGGLLMRLRRDVRVAALTERSQKTGCPWTAEEQAR
jgi:uncharacterized membrane protein YphA (DoxX/SURF4 family)